MTLQADSLEDMKLDSDREVSVDDTGDIGVTSGINTVEQSVAINQGRAIRPLIGEPVTAGAIQRIESQTRTFLRNDVQIEDVQRVEITEFDESKNSVTMEVFVGIDNSFDIQVDLL